MENEEIRIPIPNTRFILIGIKQTDNSWSNDVLDPTTGERDRCSGPNMSNAAMSLMASILTNKIFANNKKTDSIKETIKQINKII